MMRTIEQLLRKLGACDRAIKKYSGERRDFKNALMKASPDYAEFITYRLFSNIENYFSSHYPILIREANSKDYPNLPRYKYNFPPSDTNRIDLVSFPLNCRKKSYRLAYWPDIKRRLIELGVKL